MTKLLIVIIIALIITNILQVIFKPKKQSENKNIKTMPYKEKYMLTKNEYIFYKELKKIADKNYWIICPKVGLKELFEITEKENYMAHFGRISQKHIDFMICDKELRPLYAIELDDNSHNKETRKESDEFKNKIFEKSKVKLIRIKACQEYSTEYIEKNIDKTS